MSICKYLKRYKVHLYIGECLMETTVSSVTFVVLGIQKFLHIKNYDKLYRMHV